MAEKVNPPYISQKVLISFFDKMKKVARPKELSRSTLKEYGMEQAPALQSAIKFLGLIDEDYKPTDKFNKIQAHGDQFSKNLNEIIKFAYVDLFEKHPLDHASYEDVVNYFTQKYSAASAKKMAKSFAVLCGLAGVESSAFSKMRALRKTNKRELDNAKKSYQSKHSIEKEENTVEVDDKAKALTPSTKEALVSEFVKTNPIPTGVQWNAETLKAFFDQYRETIKMLRGKKD